jgi:ABC-2 type transport system ATP-binding protein
VLNGNGDQLEYTLDANQEHVGGAALLERLAELGIAFKDLTPRQSALEDIFVILVKREA